MAGLQLAFSSRTSEEGFHSGASSDDSPTYPNSAVDRIAFELSTLGLAQRRFAFGQKCNSDSGASTGELDQITMKEEVGVRGAGSTEQLCSKQKLPGAWFYEEMYQRGDDSASPTSDPDDHYVMQFLCAGRNISENVEVPSSEHVAEIVGRQGCKIKALRAKTNTYIKTPVRGEEPVFVVTGKPEDVMEAKREIECAAEHFTQIRASRRHSQGGAPAPGHVTAYVRVPLRVVGLVVGPKGATIKRIQQDTHTYIITPSREREPIFEVTGLPQNVEAARKEIEQHIYQRTGNMPITDPSASISHYAAENYNTLSMSNRFNTMAPGNGRRMDPYAEYSRHSAADLYNALGAGLPQSMRNGYSKPFSSSTSSAPSPNSMFRSSPTPFNVWCNNTYSAGLGAGLGDDAYGARSSMLSGASAWSSAFGVSCREPRDEGIGDSPNSVENPYANRLVSSIWADLEPARDENKQALLTA